jgi:hypothetical protein
MNHAPIAFGYNRRSRAPVLAGVTHHPAGPGMSMHEALLDRRKMAGYSIFAPLALMIGAQRSISAMK